MYFANSISKSISPDLMFFISLIADTQRSFDFLIDSSRPKLFTYVALEFFLSELIFFPKASSFEITSRISSVI